MSAEAATAETTQATDAQAAPNAEPTKAAKNQADAKAANKPVPVKTSFSRGMNNWLHQHKLSIAFTSYQTGRLYLLGIDPEGRLSMHERLYERAMGVVGNSQRLYMGGLYQLWRFENVLGKGQVANKMFDRCYMPRNVQYTGDVDIHELGIRADGKIVFVNTKYSCLAEPSLTHSFKAIWKPKFISKLAPEDRCHLNGLAMVDGAPKYVTAVCKSDSVDGWRERRMHGGVVIDVETDEIVCEGLSMPHSPRWVDGKLWLLNSGTGHLGYVDFEKKAFVPHTFCPGFMRGLAISGNYAAVGLSKPRNNRFEGLALDDALKEKDSEAWCGIQIINLQTGDVEQWLRLDGGVTELFDVTFLHGVRCPMALGQMSPENRDFITFENHTELAIGGSETLAE